jgi:hypothetical protein
MNIILDHLLKTLRKHRILLWWDLENGQRFILANKPLSEVSSPTS